MSDNITTHKSTVVAFAGTLGLGMLLNACRDEPWDTIGVVPPANAGAAFAQLHSIMGVSADEVLIPTLDRVQVCAVTSAGETLVGERAISLAPAGTTLERVFLTAEDAVSDDATQATIDFRPTPEVLDALARADAIVIGPGSLYTNLIPALLIKEINEAIRKSKARKIFVCNLMTQPNQTVGYTIADHVRVIQRHCGFRLDYVLVHQNGSFSDSVLQRYRDSLAGIVEPEIVHDDDSHVVIFPGTPQEMELVEGAILIRQSLATEVLEIDRVTDQERIVIRHDPDKLGRLLRAVLHDYALQEQLSVSRAIFREYDIRGMVGSELTATALESMGRAFGTYMQRRTGRNQIVLGRDVRPSSAAFAQAVTKGLIATGCEVIDIGQVPTPLASFALNHFWVDGAVQVTASHNPTEFNGLKLQVGTEALAGEELQKVERLIASGLFASGEGRRLARDVIYPYLNYITHRIRLSKPLKIAIDAGNGSAGPLALKLFRELGCEVIPLYCEPDGTFPNHQPDPAEEENMLDLCQTVVEHKCAAGVAFDGDGDRIGLVDETGSIVPIDTMLLLYAREALRNGPGKAVFEVRCSESLFDGVRKYGGIPVMARCGNTSILPRMRHERAVIGGELSGHVFFNDPPIEYDDALYAGALLLSYLDNHGVPFSQMLKELVDGLPAYVSSPELRIDCPDYLKADIVNAVRDEFAPDYRVIDIDGARIYFGQHDWALIRASNTSPKLSLRFEGESETSMNKMKGLVKQALEKQLPGLGQF